jgi:anaerobic carbon-monoxide dehydrogenase catalytic subunit
MAGRDHLKEVPMFDPHAPISITKDGPLLHAKALRDGVETVFERHQAQQPQCGFCDMGLSCRICIMGPCRVDPFGEGPQTGVCGADADIIVARNLCRMIAAGAASHSDHGRDLVEVLAAVAEGRAGGYKIREEAKLKRLAVEYGVAVEDKPALEVAGELADAMMEDYGMRRKAITLVKRAPAKRRALWDELGITPRGIDRETSETLHRTHMGVDNGWQSLLLQGLRNALSDGWGGSMIATEVSDILFGVPKPHPTMVNAGVLKADQVNIVVHGHNPVVSEMVSAACQDPDLLAQAKAQGAAGINLVGLCCTGNELLMRRGIAMAGNHLMTELILSTGAVEMMIVDYQCIMPAIGMVAASYHTQMISTSDKARFPGMDHHEFHPHNAAELATGLVKSAIANFGRRKEVYIPVAPQAAVGGFSVETILGALGGTPDPLIEAIKSGQIRGAVGIVGCNNPKILHDHGHVTLTRRLIENDILVVDTGCVSVANAKAGYKLPEAVEMAGPGLKAVCGSLGIPPVLHLGSCVDNVRILVLLSALADSLGVDLSDLPVAGSAPEWYSEKAVTIAAYFVASGVTTHLGPMPPVTGSMNVVGLLTEGLKDVVGASFAVEPDPEKAALLLRGHIESKREALGLDARKVS